MRKTRIGQHLPEASREYEAQPSDLRLFELAIPESVKSRRATSVRFGRSGAGAGKRLTRQSRVHLEGIASVVI
jgi:hypothetical protein